VLDEAERRATDPDVLEDLFKMDHLTTRMRRHAEGLIILSGAPPGRSWSAPVKLIDVMRGAVAEVEDYARVTVSTQSRAALSGSAVTDVIHLLAELIENATTLSPPFTQVRVGGETVAKGFAIEIEDRGLGMSPQKLHELNERLANPQDINPANTEQLGLFVVGQLARRHGISVMLRPSPYGGTTAVMLIPLALLVDDGPAAITAGGRAPAAGTAGHSAFSNGQASAYADDRAAWPGPGPGDWRAPAAAGYPSSGTPGHQDADRTTIRISGVLRNSPPTGGFGSATGFGSAGGSGLVGGGTEPGARRGRHETDEVHVVTGVPVRPVTPPTPAFDVFAPRRRSQPGSVPADDAPYPQSYQDRTDPSSADDGGHGPDDGDGVADEPADGTEFNGLPRRVRQANLAPQLRASAAAAAGAREAAVPQATAASLADMRNTLSAMQRGWQQGRSQTQPNTEGGADGN